MQQAGGPTQDDQRAQAQANAQEKDDGLLPDQGRRPFLEDDLKQGKVLVKDRSNAKDTKAPPGRR